MAALREKTVQPFSGEEAEAHGLAARMPALLIESQRVAHTVAHGTHGRRRAGPGETFWQFRHYDLNDARSGIDWRRSASSDHLFVREREWEAAHTVWLWVDLSASMDFRSRLASVTKRDRALVLALALAELLGSAGERVGLLGESEPILARNVAERIAGQKPHPIMYDNVPSVTYCHPEVASIGLTEDTCKERKLDYWGDPARQKPGEIYTWNGGRGVYFLDPSGHFLEIHTRPYF